MSSPASIVRDRDQLPVPRLRFHHALLIGAGITILQLCVAIGAQGERGALRAYDNLFQWDSVHYQNIALRGYYANLPVFSEGTELSKASWIKLTNVAFFPGYPLLARPLLWIFRNNHAAMLLTAQLCAAAMWACFIQLLRKYNVRLEIAILTIVFLLSHPGAFFLVTAYSESLFLLCTIGMLLSLGGDKTQKKSWLAAGLCGFAASFTRLFGLGLAALPIIDDIIRRWPTISLRDWKPWMKPAAAACLTLLGAIVFFAYCTFAFGWWDLYFIRQKMGWGMEPSFWIFDGWLLGPYVPANLTDGNEISRAITPPTAWFLILGFAGDAWTSYRAKDATFGKRFVIWSAVGILFYLPAAALMGSGWQSMLRYSFPPVLLACVALGSLWSRRRLPRIATIAIVAAVLGVSCVLFAEQLILLKQFTSEKWVA